MGGIFVKKIISLLLILCFMCFMIVPSVYSADNLSDDLIEDMEDDEEDEENKEDTVVDDSDDEIAEPTDDSHIQDSEYDEIFAEDEEDISQKLSVPDGITVILDGEIVVFDVAQPALVNNRTMVPMRKIFEALDATVTWDNNTQTAKAQKGDMTVEISIGSTVMYSNGKAVEIDSPALLLRSRTYVPVRFISNALGVNVDWDGEKKIVYLISE